MKFRIVAIVGNNKEYGIVLAAVNSKENTLCIEYVKKSPKNVKKPKCL